MFINLYFLLFLFFSPNLSEQNPPVETEFTIEPGYFSFPLSPGVTTSLSGSFGDLRVNHFHSGLDIRTGGVEGKSVFAAAEGYVSRVRISSGGYGNALYITHPNGLTTVYAHLKEFSAKIKEVVVAHQYAEQKWETDVNFEKDQIPVNKGELVAFSGNTGGSGGPHLHFEVRDPEENTLDPALYKFAEIKDNVAPFAEFISFVSKSADARVNGEFGRLDIPLKKSGSGYVPTKSVNLSGEIGVEIYAYDKAQTSPFRLGITHISLSKDGKETYAFNLEKLSFENKLDMNLHTNYEKMVTDGRKLHKCYLETGNDLNLYKTDGKNGILTFAPKPSAVEIKLKDSFGNQSNIQFSANENAVSGTIVIGKVTDKVEKSGNFLKITTKGMNNTVMLKSDNKSLILESAYKITGGEVFVYPLDNGLYKELIINQIARPFPVNFHLSKSNKIFSTSDFEADFSNAYYQNEYLNLRSTDSKLLLDEDIIPLKSNFKVIWRNKKYSVDEHIFLEGKKPKYQNSEFSNPDLIFKPKELGTFYPLQDSTGPSIRVIEQNGQKLVFKIDDNLSNIASFECLVNGKWVLMEYEFKNGLLWSEKENSQQTFSGEVILKVSDQAGNISTYQSTI